MVRGVEIPHKELRKLRTIRRERCGIIVAEGTKILRLVELPNRAEIDDDYVITMDDYMRAVLRLTGMERVLGFFHTHLPHHGPDPTDCDFDGADLHPEYNNFVYFPPTETVTWYGGLPT